VKPSWAQAVVRDHYGWYADLTVKGTAQRMRWIPPGSFSMGSDVWKAWGHTEKPMHTVQFPHGFWFGDSEVTQELWTAVMGTNPSIFAGDMRRPVEKVSWKDGDAFYRRLNALVSGLDAAFPTESRWEYACKAGTTGEHAGNVDDMSWFDENSGRTTHPVKMRQPNPWGIYDMHGNVSEWCLDWYGTYPESAVDPSGPESGTERVHRGGSWINYRSDSQSTRRHKNAVVFASHDRGLRISTMK
jgi:formylglycine-generating enzyme required for sulfatase activity